MKIVLLVLFFFLSACSGFPTPDERHSAAERLAATRDWHEQIFNVGTFDLVAYLPKNKVTSQHLTIYIEGDGFAWVSSAQPSHDPTPIDPIGLKLALTHPEGSAAYLSRPCQYKNAQTERCSQRYWTNDRFSQVIIDAENQAITQMKMLFNAQKITLVGYSGGGTVAALIAARRSDVSRLITVAGNLDIDAWADYQNIQRLNGSLNPVDEIDALSTIYQWHFVGGRDNIIPPFLAISFVNRFPEVLRPRILIEPSFNHHCCWAENWARLIEQVR